MGGCREAGVAGVGAGIGRVGGEANARVADVENEAELDLARLRAFESLVDVIAGNELDHGVDLFLRAEVDHPLGIGNAADQAPLNELVAADELVVRQLHLRLLARQAHHDHASVGAKQVHVHLHGFLHGKRVQDVVKSSLVFGHAFLGVNQARGAQLRRQFSLGVRAREHVDLVAHGFGEEHREMAEAAEAQDADLEPAALHLVVDDRRVRGDAGAQQRRGLVEGVAVGDRDDKVLAANDVAAVATEGPFAAGFAGVGVHGALAHVLVVLSAVLAVTAGANKAADADVVADLELLHRGTGLLDASHELVPGDLRKGGEAPLVAGLVDVGVAKTAVKDFHEDLIFKRVADLVGPGVEAGSGRLGGVSGVLNGHFVES